MADVKDPSSAPSEPSSSGSLPSSASLERLLGAIAKGLDGLVQGNLELRRAFAELQKEVLKAIGRIETRTDRRVADLQVAFDAFVQRVDAAVEQQKIVAKTTSEASQELVKSREQVHRAVGRLQDITDKHATLQAEDEKEEISAKWIKIRPSTLLKAAIKYSPIIFKVVAFLAAMVALAYEGIKNWAALIGGWH